MLRRGREGGREGGKEGAILREEGGEVCVCGGGGGGRKKGSEGEKKNVYI